MILARVAGRLVSTIHDRHLDGQRLLVLDKLDPQGEATGGYVIAVDSVGAGYGETVIMLDEGNGARQVLDLPGAPIRSVVVGIVDRVDVGD